VRVFVTGITGFVGRHLARRLAADGHELAGLGYADPPGGADRGDLAAAVHELDLARGEGLDALLDDFAPEAVVHLAAQSAPSLALADPAGTYRANVEGTLSLLESLARTAPRARLLFASSSEVYGHADTGPVAETAPVQPVNPYGASKAAAEILIQQQGRARGLDAVIARSFPHVGPGQRPLFALPAFARQIARIEAGRQLPPLRVGNLEARRDFLDVRDVAEAYARLLERGERGGVYNLSSGQVRSVGEGLEGLLALSTARIAVETDPELLRPNDLPRLVGDSDKVRQTTGWSPSIPFQRTLEDLMEDWRRRIEAGEDA
jgi:GDP-4-dehydro-6-deoxy-D-mannose reductase